MLQESLNDLMDLIEALTMVKTLPIYCEYEEQAVDDPQHDRDNSGNLRIHYY